MTWVKGQSGNAGGRTPQDRRVKKLARNHTEKAINQLVKMMDCDVPSAVVSACNAILDRAYGRPKQVIDATVSRRMVDVIESSERRDKLRAALASRTAEPEKPTIQ